MARAGDLEVTVDVLPDGAAVVRVQGDVDMATANILEDALAGVEATPRLVVDLSSCGFIDSSGVRVLVTTSRRVRDEGVDIAVVAHEQATLRVLEIAALDTFVTVHPTLESALS
ncbi:MAG: STAS domain-containing protein [Gaiellaceae bacterium]